MGKFFSYRGLLSKAQIYYDTFAPWSFATDMTETSVSRQARIAEAFYGWHSNSECQYVEHSLPQALGFSRSEYQKQENNVSGE
jgi:hypothetical protein